MSQDTAIKTPKMDIRLRIIGIAKRQRTVKVHNLDVLKDLNYQDVDLNSDTYKDLAYGIIRSTMRTVERVELYLSPWDEVEYHGYPHAMKEVRFADPRYRKIMLEDAWRYVQGANV